MLHVILKYKTYFYAIIRYATISISIESERIRKFVKGLAKFYQWATTQMVVLGAFFKGIISILRCLG